MNSYTEVERIYAPSTAVALVPELKFIRKFRCEARDMKPGEALTSALDNPDDRIGLKKDQKRKRQDDDVVLRDPQDKKSLVIVSRGYFNRNYKITKQY